MDRAIAKHIEYFVDQRTFFLTNCSWNKIKLLPNKIALKRKGKLRQFSYKRNMRESMV